MSPQRPYYWEKGSDSSYLCSLVQDMVKLLFHTTVASLCQDVMGDFFTGRQISIHAHLHNLHLIFLNFVLVRLYIFFFHIVLPIISISSQTCFPLLHLFHQFDALSSYTFFFSICIIVLIVPTFV